MWIARDDTYLKCNISYQIQYIGGVYCIFSCNFCFKIYFYRNFLITPAQSIHSYNGLYAKIHDGTAGNGTLKVLIMGHCYGPSHVSTSIIIMLKMEVNVFLGVYLDIMKTGESITHRQ